MPVLEAVDAKIDRARSEMRLLKADIAAFCEERARLIVREECDDEQERWVYRGDTPKAPIQWSIRAGEFAYNLRSAFDHLVWQLVEVNGGCPGRHTAFPIQDHPNQSNFKRDLRGVSPAAMEYIKSVQPYQTTEQWYLPDSDRVCRGLAMLHEINNMDKHRHLAIANARWTGEDPKSVTRASFHPMPKFDEKSYLDPKSLAREFGDFVINHELQNGQALLVVPLFNDSRYLEFAIDAFFDELLYSHTDDRKFSVSETLDACIDSVEMVVSHLRKKF